ncbi:hypothetical protein D3C76_1185130 [compost metagenome]
MNRHVQVFILAIAFDFYWTMVVFFRERGVMVWLALALLACLMLKPIQRLYAILLAVAGSSLDTLWSLTGLLRFNGEGILPLWMMALWLMFACVWTQLTTTTALPRWLLVLMGTAGGPVAYFLGERLDAIVFQAPAFIVLSWMTMGWLVLILFFHLLVGRQP